MSRKFIPAAESPGTGQAVAPGKSRAVWLVHVATGLRGSWASDWPAFRYYG